jgi:RNA polymerase sigma factor (sigma-70 family)
MNGQSITGVIPISAGSDSVQRAELLFDTHYDHLYRLARRLTPSIDDALDLVQETFVRAVRSLKSVPSSAREEEAWLVRTLVNIRRDQWRREKVRRLHDIEGVREETVSSEHSLNARMMVWKALDQLAPRRRAIVVMHELEGLGIPHIARILKITSVTVRWHLSMGRRELARSIPVEMK